MKILLPDYVLINEIEDLIVTEFPNINERYKSKSFEYAERILILFHFVSIGIQSNRKIYYFKNDKLSFEDIEKVQIPSKIIKAIFGYSSKSKISYTKILDILREYIKIEKIIINNKEYDFYITGKKCKEFSFFKIGKFKEYELKSKIIKELLIEIKKKITYNELLTKEENNIRYHVIENTKKIKLDDNQKVINILLEYLNDKFNPQAFLDLFNQNLFESKVDSFGLRLHTPITSLKKTLHQYLNVEGERVKIIDIPNSQPFFSSIINSNLLNQLFGCKDWTYLKDVIEIFKKYDTNSDFLNYKKLCADAQLYEYLMYEFKIHDRNEAKELFYIIAFSDYEKKQSIKKREIFEKFKTNFPSVYNCFKEIKALNFNSKEIKKGNYTNNCLIFQRVESFFIYHIVAKNLIEKDIFFTTIHDSIMCKESDFEVVRKIFIESFIEIGVSPPQSL